MTTTAYRVRRSDKRSTSASCNDALGDGARNQLCPGVSADVGWACRARTQGCDDEDGLLLMMDDGGGSGSGERRRKKRRARESGEALASEAKSGPTWGGAAAGGGAVEQQGLFRSGVGSGRRQTDGTAGSEEKHLRERSPGLFARGLL